MVTRAARWAYPILAWAFVLGLVLQVFFIGLGLFGGRENIELHIAFGWLLHLAPLLVLLAAALSRAGRKHWTWALSLVAVMFFVPILPILRDASAVVAALHPVLALAAFWVSVVVARQSLEVVRQPAAREAAPAEVSL
jgi:hypothetical protein